MLAACEAGEVFALLEGGAAGARDAAAALGALYGAVREPWLTRALLHYHARTGSARALDLLARAPDAHAKHLLDALAEQLRSERAPALCALAPLVARRPPWLHRLAAHPLSRELLRAARVEREPLPLLNALLALAALLPAAPALAAACPADLADALLRPVALEPPPSPATRAHLLLAQRALFHALYATHPCTLVEALRAHGAELAAGAPRDAWERAVGALAECVRLHPALVTGSRLREADPARWARVEIHDVVAECRRLSLHSRAEEPAPSPLTVVGAAPPPAPARASPAPGSGAHAARAVASLRPGAEPWFALGDRCGADSAPHTPLPADVGAPEPPEAAVEATPENTPARETRAQFRFPADSGAVRAIGRRSRPASPPRKETSPSAALGEGYASRLARVALERRAADSPVSFAGAPPPAGAAVARPEPSRPAPLDTGAVLEPLNVEDREVLELTARAHADDDWADALGAGLGRERARALDPRAGHAPLAARRTAPAPRRAASCSARLPAGRRVSVAVQTVDTWPEPHEFLIADFFRSMPDDTRRISGDSQGGPSSRLDAYMAELYAGRSTGTRAPGDLAEQLALAHAQLMYERWRRDAHAERNRRLLGRCRQVRALELQNAALHERVRAAARERDELRARLQRAAPAPAPAAAPDAPDALERALAEERAARLRAEAALREAEACRALDAGELQRTRGESFEAARHVEALARAALAAERRAEHVRRLRRELLVLAEREARLGAAARGGAAAAAGAAAERAAQDERALRAALARAEAEAEAGAARAEMGAARAHELEAQLAAREAQVAELKRGARLAAEEGAARLRALHDKYAALLRVLRAADARALERLAAPPRG